MVVLLGLAAFGAAELVYLSLSTSQPNIHKADVNIPPPVPDPRTLSVLTANESGHFNFSSIANSPGTYSYSMIFNNSINPSTTKTIKVNWTDPTEGSQTQTFILNPNAVHNITVPMRFNQAISGSASVSGNPGDKIGFFLNEQSCTQRLSFSFSLVNPGGASGYATVHLLVDGRELWTMKYYVPAGGETPGSGSTILQDCNHHNTTLGIVSQEKA